MRTIFGGLMAIILLVSGVIFFQAFRPSIEESNETKGSHVSLEEATDRSEEVTQDKNAQKAKKDQDALEIEGLNEALEMAGRRLEYQSEIWSLDFAQGEYDLDFVRTIPENLVLVIAETVDYRLDTVDVENLPKEVLVAIWPDNLLTLTDRRYMLLNPPTDIMKAYYVPAVTEDLGDLYFDAMEASNGLFVDNETMLLENTPLGQLVIASLAQREKTVMALQNSIDPDLNKVIERSKVDFEKVDYVIDAGASDFSVSTQWRRVLEQAAHGEELNVVMKAQGEAVEELKAAIAENAAIEQDAEGVEEES